MFYANSTFVAYVHNFDFFPITNWAQCVASNASPPQVTVHVKLLTRIQCVYELLDLVRDWRDVDHEKMHLKIHNAYANQPVARIPGFDQREQVVKAIHIAEGLRQQGDFSEQKLRAVCHEELEAVDRVSLRTRAIEAKSCCWKSPGAFHIDANSSRRFEAGRVE